VVDSRCGSLEAERASDLLAGVPPNPQLQPTGRWVPSSARALAAVGDQRTIGLCGRGHEGLQLISIS
jgi:hypothetical protein